MPSSRPVHSRCLTLLARILLPVAGLGLPTLAAAQATPAVSTIVAFYGSFPQSPPVLGTDGALYGTTSASSPVTGGLVYRTTVDGSDITTLHQFALTDGYQPQGGLLLRGDGRLYGTTRLGDVSQASTTGTIFSLAQDGSGYTTLHRFAAFASRNSNLSPINTDGAYPESALVEGSDGYLYGVTRGGGPNGTGVVFKISPDGTGFQVLHAFAAITSAQDSSVLENTDGASPVGGVIEGADGYFYGVTYEGGINGRGTIYRVRFDGSGFQTLHVFTATTTVEGVAVNTDGTFPAAGLADGGDGTFYGTTASGGPNGLGTLFAISPDGATFDVLHDFEAAGGSRPGGALLLGDDGRLYGTATAGGTTSTGTVANFGTIFVIARDGTGYAKLHDFDNENGIGPIGKLVRLSATALAGITSGGGGCGQGTLFYFSFTGDTVEGNTRCGRRRNNDNGGGATGPALLLLLGLLGGVRRFRVA